MEYIRLLDRCSLVHSPISLLVRLPDVGMIGTVVRRASKLLAFRNPFDELVVVVPRLAGRVAPPSGRVRVRTLAVDDVAAGSSYAAGLAACRWPRIVATDPLVSLTRSELQGMLDLLEITDLAVGRRRRLRGWWKAWPFEKLFRLCLGVPLADPLCPIRAMRRSAVVGVLLQTRGPLVECELIAKLTYLTCLLEELPLNGCLAMPPGLASLAMREYRQVFDLLFRPRFWRFETGSPQFRPDPTTEAAPPVPRVQTVSANGRCRRRAGRWAQGFPRSALADIRIASWAR